MRERFSRLAHLAELRDSLGLARIELRADNLIEAEAALKPERAADCRYSDIWRSPRHYGYRRCLGRTANSGRALAKQSIAQRPAPRRSHPRKCLCQSAATARIRSALHRFPAYRSGREKGGLAIDTQQTYRRPLAIFRRSKALMSPCAMATFTGCSGPTAQAKPRRLKCCAVCCPPAAAIFS